MLRKKSVLALDERLCHDRLGLLAPVRLSKSRVQLRSGEAQITRACTRSASELCLSTAVVKALCGRQIRKRFDMNWHVISQQSISVRNVRASVAQIMENKAMKKLASVSVTGVHVSRRSWRTRR